MPSDDDSDLHPQEAHTRCSNERRLRVLEKKVDAHDDRLMEGTRTMDKLTTSVESLTKSVDILNLKIVDQSRPNPLVQKIVEAAIGVLVPAAIVMLIWALVTSGAVPVKMPTPAHQGTNP